MEEHPARTGRLETCHTVAIQESSGAGAALNEIPSCRWLLRRQSHNGVVEQQIAITLPVFSIGRSASSHLSLNDPTVSSRHAELVLIDDDLFVRDVNSTNGTMLNGRPVTGLFPVRHRDILHFGSVMCTICQPVEESLSSTVSADVSADALGQLQFDKLLQRPALQPFFQPIRQLKSENLVGFEILIRSTLIGLETPEKMFRIAEQRNSQIALSQLCRSEGLRIGEMLGQQFRFFLNTHPSEVGTETLFESLVQLRTEAPDLRVVVEIHEATSVSTQVLHQIRQVTRGLDMELAYDDFGSGQARIIELFEIPPDFLKFDMKFIRSLATARTVHRETVKSLLRIIDDLGVIAIAEGVESADEADICQQLGFSLAQGFLFGRAMPAAHWSRSMSSHENDGSAW
ncbi:MAG: EAL domain-containing protein [Planctomycetaceae bacterium]|nr:EAL domain-containing protein [Planctomycetaceae bacterium]